MASRGSSAGREAGRHRWRGVVQDLVALDLGQHSYPCILQHTSNLVARLARGKGGVAAALQRPLLTTLVALLQHQDVRDCARLQHEAVKALGLIVKHQVVTDLPLLLDEGVIAAVLHLLQFENDELRCDALSLLRDLFETVGYSGLDHHPGGIQAVLQVTKSRNPLVKRTALRVIFQAFSDDIPSLEEAQHYLRELLGLMSDEDTVTVLITCDILVIMAEDGCDEIAFELSSPEFLSVFADRLRRVTDDPRHADVASNILSCIRSLASKGSKYVDRILKSGIVDCLPPFLRDDVRSTRQHVNASWILTHVINSSDDDVTARLVERGLLPSVRDIVIVGCSEEADALSMLLQRLLLNSNYVKNFLGLGLMSWLTELRMAGDWRSLQLLLIIFKESLQEIKKKARLEAIRDCMMQSGHLETLGDLQNCCSISFSAADVINEILID